jgi:hypothetical protein
MVGGIKSRILDFLYQHPTRDHGYWTATGIAKKLDERESSVRKVTSKFQKCGVLSSQQSVRVPISRRVVKDAWGHIIERKTVYRTEVPCKFTDVGKRLAELMGFAREHGVFSVEAQKQRLANNPVLLARFREGGFTDEEVKSAVACGLIYERPTKVYTPSEGMINHTAVASALRGQVRYVETRYKLRAM